MPNSESLIVVVRSSGERTTSTSQHLLEQELPGVKVVIVKDFPFEKTLTKCFEIGKDSGMDWMMAIDADVIVRKGEPKKLFEEAKKLPKAYFQIQARVYDKFTGSIRDAGNRIYRTCLLPKAIGLIPPQNLKVRPESEVINKMVYQGHPSRKSNLIIGIHGFHQSYLDIYRTVFVYSTKFTGRIAKVLSTWKVLAADDDDFLIALRAAYDGLISMEPAHIDKRMYQAAALKAIQELGLKEKNDLNTSAIDFASVEKMFEGHKKRSVYTVLKDQGKNARIKQNTALMNSTMAKSLRGLIIRFLVRIIEMLNRNS